MNLSLFLKSIDVLKECPHFPFSSDGQKDYREILSIAEASASVADKEKEKH